jgi:putative acetyltransferase
MIAIRNYQPGEEKQLWALFFHTVRNVNTKDYNQAQVEAWAPDEYDADYWCGRIAKINPFVALIDDEIVGYADVQPNGYIDHFFCHHQHQGKGIGKALINHLITTAKAQGIEKLWADASETAKPFFVHFGFTVVKAQTPEIRGQKLNNYLVEMRL